MEKYIGKSVYKGTAIGPVSVLKKKDSLVKRIHIDNTAEELKRLDAAKERTMTQLGQLYEKALQEVGEVNAAIFEVHQMMLEDDDYQDAIHSMIQNEEVNAEYAVAVTGDNFAEMFANMDDEYMQARSADDAEEALTAAEAEVKADDTKEEDKDEQLTYVALGDSIVSGVGLADVQYSARSGYSVDMTPNFQGYSPDCYVGKVAAALGLDRDHAINLGLPALTAPDLADMIRYGKMPQMNMASGCEYNYPEFQDYIRKADVVSVQIGSNDAFVPCIVALGNATNWKSEKLAATILAGDLRNEGSGSTMSAIYRSIKAMDLTKAERDATWNLLFSGMSKICDETYPKTTAALISIVQEIRNLNPDAQIILVGYTNPVPLIPCWRSYFNKLNKFEKQIAKTYNLTYVAIPNTETTLDVHPTIKGHQYIANKLVNAIENP